MAAPGLTVGTGSIALVQNGAVQETIIDKVTPIPAVLPAASTAGNMLLLAIGTGNPGAAPSITNMPLGWVKLTGAIAASATDWEFWAFPINPGGITAISPTANCGVAGARWYTHMSEWSGVIGISYLDASGTATATAGTTLVPTTTTAPASSKNVVIAGWMQQIAGSTTVTFTSPTGFTRLIDTQSLNRFQHLDIEYASNIAPGSLLGVTLTSDTASTQAAGGVIVLKAQTTLVDHARNIGYGSVNLKLNTADFRLALGGKYRLEDGSGYYQLEDGSGSYLIDWYTPQLGDPIAFTNPTWSGRVVSVETRDYFDLITNYQEVAIEATNNATGPGGAPPGDLSDTATGGYYQLEGSTDRYQLEDGSGLYVLEGTAFRYRNLSLRQTQYQDGTTGTYGSLETFEGGFAAGQTFRLYSTNQGISGTSYTITNVNISFLGADSAGQPTPLYTIEFGDAYQTLQTAGGGVLTRTASVATQQLGVVQPAGTLGYAQVTTDQGTFTALTDLTGLAIPVTVTSGRRIRLTAFADFASVAGDVVGLQILEGSTLQKEFQLRVGAVADSKTTIGGSVIIQPTAGVHTYKVAARRVSGTGNVTMYATAPTGPAYIVAEDIGT